MAEPFPLLSRLREETSAIHQELEDSMDIFRWIARPGGYRDLLIRYYGFHRAVEPRLEQHFPACGGGGYDPAARRKSPWLARDLSAPGLGSGREEALPLCPAEWLPDLPDQAAAFGCAYVLEGSTLGGRHILARLTAGGPDRSSTSPAAASPVTGHHSGERTAPAPDGSPGKDSPLPFIPDTALHFFRAYGAETGRKWQEFLQALAAFGETAGAGDFDRAATAARDTFSAFARWMRPGMSTASGATFPVPDSP